MVHSHASDGRKSLEEGSYHDLESCITCPHSPWEPLLYCCPWSFLRKNLHCIPVRFLQVSINEKNFCSYFSSPKLHLLTFIKWRISATELGKVSFNQKSYLHQMLSVLNNWIWSIFDKATHRVLLKEDAIWSQLGKWILKTHPHLLKQTRKWAWQKSMLYNMLYIQIQRLHLRFSYYSV